MRGPASFVVRLGTQSPRPQRIMWMVICALIMLGSCTPPTDEPAMTCPAAFTIALDAQGEAYIPLMTGEVVLTPWLAAQQPRLVQTPHPGETVSGPSSVNIEVEAVNALGTALATCSTDVGFADEDAPIVELFIGIPEDGMLPIRTLPTPMKMASADNVGVTDTFYYLDGENVGMKIPEEALVAGTHCILAAAVDAAGNEGRSAAACFTAMPYRLHDANYELAEFDCQEGDGGVELTAQLYLTAPEAPKGQERLFEAREVLTTMLTLHGFSSDEAWLNSGQIRPVDTKVDQCGRVVVDYVVEPAEGLLKACPERLLLGGHALVDGWAVSFWDQVSTEDVDEIKDGHADGYGTQCGTPRPLEQPLVEQAPPRQPPMHPKNVRPPIPAPELTYATTITPPSDWVGHRVGSDCWCIFNVYISRPDANIDDDPKRSSCSSGATSLVSAIFAPPAFANGNVRVQSHNGAVGAAGYAKSTGVCANLLRSSASAASQPTVTAEMVCYHRGNRVGGGAHGCADCCDNKYTIKCDNNAKVNLRVDSNGSQSEATGKGRIRVKTDCAAIDTGDHPPTQSGGATPTTTTTTVGSGTTSGSSATLSPTSPTIGTSGASSTSSSTSVVRVFVPGGSHTNVYPDQNLKIVDKCEEHLKPAGQIDASVAVKDHGFSKAQVKSELLMDISASCAGVDMGTFKYRAVLP